MRIILHRHWLVTKVNNKASYIRLYGIYTRKEIEEIIEQAYYGQTYDYLYDDERLIAYDIEQWQIAKYGKEVVEK